MLAEGYSSCKVTGPEGWPRKFPGKVQRSKIGPTVRVSRRPPMNTEEYVGRWSAMMLEVITGMAEWRQQHPKATLREIEMEMDLRWAYVRVGMAEDLALASTAADWEKAPIDQQPHCSSCGTVLKREGGKKKRHLKTQGGQEMVLERHYGVCPTCASRSFPPG
jgi:hypothetical protein